jgi:nucleoside-diphosphate-sugar epimerase
MTTVLLTGAGGFLGTQVLAALLRRDYAVHAIDRKRPAGMDAAGVTWHSVDLFERDAVHALFDSMRPQGLIHLAWITKHGLYWRSPSNIEWLAASLLLLQDFARFGGQRAVIAGSSAEYQWGGLGNLDEMSSPIIPDSLYGTSKNALREVVEKWAPVADVSWAWARFFNMFGPGENPARLVPKVIRTLLDDRELSFDSGAIVRDFLHVEDAGDAVAALFQSSVQGPVNVASGQQLSVRDVIASVATYMQVSDRVHFDAQANRPEPARIVASVGRLHDEVGWQSQKGVIERLHETCDWWRLAKD